VVATIGLFLLAGSRRLAALFVAATALFVGAGVLLTQVASDGRFLSNVRALSVAGYGGAAHLVVDTPIRVVSLAQNFAGATWLLAPLAVGIALVRFSTRSWTVFDVALPVVAIATVGILADAGTYVNHLLEGSAIVLVLVGSIWSRAESDPARALDVILCAAVCLALVVGIATTLKPIAGQTLDDIRADGSLRYGPQLAARAVHKRDTLLAEDPGIPYELRRRPVVGDAFMLPRIGRRYPLELALLTRKIRDGRFDKIILDGVVTDRFYYTNGDLGPAVSTAIARSYELKRVVAGRFVYVPRGR
jgi:hypothetical protein